MRTRISVDPYHKSRGNPIKKLEGVSAETEQFRLRSGRFRFCYDIEGTEVALLCCGLRSEETY